MLSHVTEAFTGARLGRACMTGSVIKEDESSDAYSLQLRPIQSLQSPFNFVNPRERKEEDYCPGKENAFA